MGITVMGGDDAARQVGEQIKQGPGPRRQDPKPAAAPDQVRLTPQSGPRDARLPDPALPMGQANGVPFLPAYRFSSGNKVDLFYDAAEIQPQMEKLIGEARHSIKLDYFIFSGREASRLADMMLDKVRQGVKVQVLLDPRLGSLADMKASEQAIIARLKAGGVQVAFSNYEALPPLINKKDDVAGRLIDHNKIIIVDDRAAMIGGWNLADKFTRFHDGEVRIDGPAVGDLVQQHALDWHFATHPEAARQCLATPQLPGQDHTEQVEGRSAVRINSTGINRQNNQWAILENICRARKSIYITMIELDDRSILDALIVAKNRGVDVRVLLDPSDFKGIVPALEKGPREWVNARAAKTLLEAQVPVHYFKTSPQQDVVHAKMAVFDGEALLIGSADWQTKELCHTSDTAAEVHGGPAVQRAQQQFLADWQHKSYAPQTPPWYKQLLNRLYFKYS